jgi:uncharacterized phage-associated protein
MTTALSVAKELIRLSYAGEPQPLTPLSIQKLLYYAQGWSLALRDSDLFTEPIQARESGPVVGAVWKALPKAPALEKGDAKGGSPLDEEEAAFVKAVWGVYGQYSPGRLTDMTRRESPWLDAWGGGPKDDTGREPITSEALYAYFSRRPVPSLLAAHTEYLQGLDRRAREEMAARPPLDEAVFMAKAVRHRAGARR